MTNPKTLLIVDDSRVSRMMIRSLVTAKRPQWTITEAASGEEALQLVGQQQPDFCTMDINMPGLLGTDAAEQIVRDHPAVRLALFSANIQESQKTRASRMGVKFVAKPVSEKSVMETIVFFESCGSMILSELQLDALAEVFNVGAGQAAANLSEIVGDEVRLSVPHIQFYDRAEISPGTLALADQRVGAVRQRFSGPFNLDASLLFKEERALEIVQEMIGSQVSVQDLVDFEQEAMCELGNIILNGCMSTIADVLQIQLSSTLPEYTVDTSDAVVTNLLADMNQPVVMVLHIDLTIEKRQTHGYLVFLLSSSSLAELVIALDRFLGRI